jgi:hypothetical protein
VAAEYVDDAEGVQIAQHGAVVAAGGKGAEKEFHEEGRGARP